ncbi:MAG: preprotein translocase subunit SecG [Paludibacteraceae bacterium]|nr:preprotein translocase subunit SecG [Paludibacteraceae bacterium]
MMTFLTILIVIAAILLVLLVLVQNSKGGGLAAGLSSGNQVMGAPKTADFLEKASWTLMAIIIVLSIVSAGFNSSSSEETTDSVTAKAAELAEGMAPSVDPANTDVATTGEETPAQ